MIKLEYYNDTIVPLSDQVFGMIIDLINDEFTNIYPKSFEKRKDYFLTLTIVNDDVIQKINKEQRGKDEPTDVVSLSYIESDKFPGNDMIGEIFISWDTAQKQAIINEMEELDELKFLFVHGILHILGYEHKSEEDFQTMMNLTNQILAIQG